MLTVSGYNKRSRIAPLLKCERRDAETQRFSRRRPSKKSVLIDRRSAEAEVRSSEPQACGAVGGEMLMIHVSGILETKRPVSPPRAEAAGLCYSALEPQDGRSI